MEKYNFKKSTCERYDIRWGDFGWAIITIDENGGVFNAQSDYGNYSYSWPNHGRKSFKHFILELARDKSYFLGKVASNDYFYYDKSVKAWEKTIIDMRKSNGDYECTKEQAREMWDFLHSLDDYSSNAAIIQKEIYESNIIGEIFDEPWYIFDTIHGFSPDAHAFADEVMPMFAEILKQEIKEKTA
jgi:hypothetical protein